VIPESLIYGGAKFTTISSTVMVAMGSGRVQKFKNTSGASRDVVLPPPSRFRVDQCGGVTWYVLNDSTSTSSIVLKYARADGSQVTLATLAPSSNASVLLLSVGPAVTDEKYIYLARTKNTQRASVSGTRGAISNPASVGSMIPADCFEGGNCERAKSLGNAPLDGRDGRALVLAPMFYNSCDALNSKREPIRVADTTMPSVVVVGFASDEFEVDAVHPLGSSGLSDEFFVALYNNSRPHGLPYTGTAHGRSDHWHHVRYNSSGMNWYMKPGGLDVRRHVWSKTIPYGPVDNPTMYNLELRYVIEHTVNPEPVLPDDGSIPTYTSSRIRQFHAGPDNYLEDIDGHFISKGFSVGMQVRVSGFTGGGYNGIATITSLSAYLMGLSVTLTTDEFGEPVTIGPLYGGVGGVNDTTYGANGSLAMVYAFTDEVSGAAYTPVGAGAPITFTRDNPCVWGDADGIGEGQDDKFCHPQLCIASNQPTLFQAPCQSNYVPIIDREQTTEGTLLRNKSYCYEVGNGAPWCTCNNSPNAISALYGIKGNVVFGDVYCATMTTGGGITSSLPTEYVCIENGAGVGRTLLKPTRPGWDDDCGTLDVATGSSMTIAVCVGPNDCADTANCDGGKAWPRRELVGCAGHPDEPFDGVGGTHECFHNGVTTVTNCCTSIDNASTVGREACVRTRTTYDASCSSTGTTCESTILSTVIELMLEDYDYSFGSPTGRAMSWIQYRPDPTHPARDYTYASTNVGDIVQEIGTWTFNVGSIDVASHAGHTAVRALIRYNPTSPTTWDWYGQQQTVTINKLQLGSHGIGCGVNGGAEFDGYGGITKVTGVNQITAELNYYAAGSYTTLASVVINTAATSALAVWRQHGSSLSFSVTPAGGSLHTITANHCALVNGQQAPCLFSEDTSGTNVQFDDDWTIVDLVRDFVEVSAALTSTTSSVSWNVKASDHYGTCGDSHQFWCGGAYHTDWSESLQSYLSPPSVGAITMPNCPSTSGTNPTVLGGSLPDCICGYLFCTSPPSWSCPDCPGPYASVDLQLPTGCGDGSASMCGGFSYWTYSFIVCT
jgi:hypothetical protein